MGVITLTTDFGTRDWFVGTMKGVILGVNPKVTLVDLTHEIPPGDIRAGAFAVSSSCRFFPKGSIHVAVVDPGVGSSRRAVAVKTKNGYFIGPDNGVLSWALKREQVLAIHELKNRAYFLPAISATFHGRDAFAPAAAHLSRGLPVSKLGPAMKDIVRLPWPEVSCARDRVKGEVIYIDRFGNAITNISDSALRKLASDTERLVLRGTTQICRVAGFYSAVPSGGAVAVMGSSGFLEIAVNGGNAARKLKLRVGTRIMVRSRPLGCKSE